MYKAVDIAKYIINKCISLGRPISNLQLQKILYYVQGEYICKTGGEVLFNENIEAWPYGPVIPEVYYEFNGYSSSNINVKQNFNNIGIIEKNIIDPIIEEKSLLSAWKLVQQTHQELPWKKTYVQGTRKRINLDIMKEFFC